jgi:PAS domain S-box-containing protein
MGGRSTRTYLLAQSLALVLPVALVSIWLAVGLQRSEEERFAQQGRQVVRAASLAIEVNLRGLTSTMELLAASPSLADGDLEAFRAEALAAAAIEKAVIVLRDRSSRQLVNSAAAPGAQPATTRLSEIDAEVLRTGQPMASNHYRGVLGGTPQFAIVVPVRRNGEIVYFLSAGVPSERLREVLRSYNDGFWRTGVLGRDGVVITRARDPDIPGTRPPAAAAAAEKADEGYFETISADGEPSAVAFLKMPSGWTLIGVASVGEYRQAQRTRLGTTVAAGFALVALGIVAALLMARRISEPLLALRAAGVSLSRGEALDLPRSGNLEADGIAQALTQASVALRAREAELATTHARYKNLFEAIDDPVCIVALIRDDDGKVVDYRYVEVNPAYRREMGFDEVAGRTRREMFPNDEPSWLDVFDAVARTGVGERFEFEMRSARRWYVAHATRLPHARDQLAVISEDITERKRTEATRELLINELNHRVKNTLAAVQSLALQSLRGARGIEEGRQIFMQRLMALSRAHNILTDRSWQSADLVEIAAESAKPFDGPGGRILRHGPSVPLSPKAALALSMVLHELATNATKYGALLADGGAVDLSWRIDEGQLRLVWRERGGPPAAPTARTGFGTKLIERSLEGDLGGRAEMDFAPDGLVCTMTMPLGAITAQPPTPPPASPPGEPLRSASVDAIHAL